MISADVILPLDPELEHAKWQREFEWHLDLLPPLMDAIVTETLPRVRATQLDKVIVTGGGHVDNMTAFLTGFDQSSDGSGVEPGGAVRDALHLWGVFVEYVHAVTAWLNLDVPVPFAPILPPVWGTRPNPDPLSARGLALTTVGWLIDHADRIEQIPDLDDYREEMFGLIRQMRGRYGVFSRARRPRRICSVCGERAVVVVWVDGLNGSPRPVRAGRCGRCGQVYREGDVVEGSGDD